MLHHQLFKVSECNHRLLFNIGVVMVVAFCVSTAHVGATRTYFGSCCGMKKLKTSGKYKTKVVLQRRKNRVVRVSLC